MCIPGDIYKVETLNSAQACMPTTNATPNSVLPLTEYAPAVQVFKHEIGPHSKGEAESLRHQPVSNSRSQKVPVQFQSSPLAETCKQFPVQFQSSCPLEHHMRAPLQPPHSDRFPKQGSVQPPLSRLVEHLPQSNIAPRQGSREEVAQALCQVVLSPITLGKPHIIANAHTKKLENLPPLKQEDGQRLLAFSRSLNVAERTLTGMGPQYVGDLSHTNTLRELNRQLPLFMSQVKRMCG